jgi:hypothetical protein
LFHTYGPSIPDKILPVDFVELFKYVSHAKSLLVGLPETVLVIFTTADAILILPRVRYL